METNFEEMSPLEFKNFLREAVEKAIKETEENRIKKAEAALHDFFETLDSLGIRLRDCYSGEILEETDFYFDFVYGLDEE